MDHVEEAEPLLRPDSSEDALQPLKINEPRESSVETNRGRTVYFVQRLRLYTVLLAIYRSFVVLLALGAIGFAYVAFPRIPTFSIVGFNVPPRPNSSAPFNFSQPNSLLYEVNGTLNFTLHNPNFYELVIKHFVLVVSYGPLPFSTVHSAVPIDMQPGATVAGYALFEVKINLTDVAEQLASGGPMEKFLLNGFLPTLFQALFDSEFIPTYAGNVTFSLRNHSLVVDVSGVTDITLTLGENKTANKPPRLIEPAFAPIEL